ncbi:hypothetical protein HPB48_011140 [Haemaphysalis longicornis]|uniref:PiggyBac transposable element-derived protein domain-containing protein n=1 Tax=Haemaphysalis longicornis TaxID=44386 RepID=A0A9J6GJM1_HAELO|nr:hypothetical protein HPB48_011140 [Haemaphysalis longicornis]
MANNLLVFRVTKTCRHRTPISVVTFQKPCLLNCQKTNRYSVLQEGKSVNTDEQQIRKLIVLPLAMGFMRYPRLWLYGKPERNKTLVASTELSRNRFEKLKNNLHIVDGTQPDSDDRL